MMLCLFVCFTQLLSHQDLLSRNVLGLAMLMNKQTLTMFQEISYFRFQFCKLNYLNDIRNYIAFWMRLRLSSDSSFLLSTYVFAMAAAANLYFYFWYQQLKLIYVAFLRQDHRAKCETISLFPLTTNNSIAEKGFLSSVKHISYPSALPFWHSLDVHDIFSILKYLV